MDREIKVELPASDIPPEWLCKALQCTSKNMHYRETADFTSITVGDQIYQFEREGMNLTVTIENVGEPGQKLFVAGKSEQVLEFIIDLIIRLTFLVQQPILNVILPKKEVKNLARDEEKLVKEYILKKMKPRFNKLITSKKGVKEREDEKA